jgi:hypothetical protein
MLFFVKQHVFTTLKVFLIFLLLFFFIHNYNKRLTFYSDPEYFVLNKYFWIQLRPLGPNMADRPQQQRLHSTNTLQCHLLACSYVYSTN